MVITEQPSANRSAEQIADIVIRIIEDKWGEAFAKLSTLPTIKTAAESARRDVGLVIRRLDGDYGKEPLGVESCTLKGAKRRQFLRLCELKRENPAIKLRQCARRAIDEVLGEDGYGVGGAQSLVEYAMTHRSWWISNEKTKGE